jgi:peptide/nickel transport system substrate-binding protein
MNEGWSTARVITLLLLAAVLFASWHVLRSLDRQQADVRANTERVEALAEKIEEARQVLARLEGKSEVVVRYAPGAPPEDGAGEPATPPGGAAAPLSEDGKDALGRPLAPSAGFELYPPLGSPEIPGRTVARRPESIPALGGTYQDGQTSEPDKINYYLTNDGLASRIDRYVHERLFTINPDDPQELWPELAVAWETSEDKLAYRFHLRKGVEFSDGSPFDADDVVFTYEAMMDPAVEAEHLRPSFDLVESVRKLDRYTVEVRMRKRYWKALRQFGYNLRLLPNEFFEREIPRRAAALGRKDASATPGEPGFAAAFNAFARDMPPGTGPYAWREGESWVTNQHLTLFPFSGAWLRELNPDHYRVENLRWRIIKDDVARQEEFRKGTLDTLVVDHDAWYDRLRNDPTILEIANHFIYDHIGLLYSFLAFNCRRPPFDDPAVRRAVAHLVDRETILRDLHRGHGQIAVCPTKPIYREYSRDLEPRRFDAGRAAEILAAAGWKDSDGDGLLDKGGRPLEFSFSVPQARTFFRTVTTLLQEACQKAGIRVNANPKEWSLFLEDFYKRNFDLVCLVHSANDPWIDPYEMFHSSQAGERAGNFSGWIHPEVDRLVEAMQEEFDDAKRAEMFHRLNRLFDEEVPFFLLVHSEVGVLVNKRIRGAKVRPTGIQTFDVWIEPKDW